MGYKIQHLKTSHFPNIPAIATETLAGIFGNCDSICNRMHPTKIKLEDFMTT
jgi:hypothetical protein